VHPYGRMRCAHVPGLASLPRSGAAETFVPTPTSTCLWRSSRGTHNARQQSIKQGTAQRASLLPHTRSVHATSHLISSRAVALGWVQIAVRLRDFGDAHAIDEASAASAGSGKDYGA
jgi:hypothetical protein